MATDEFELTFTVGYERNTRGILCNKSEMYELWSSGDKFSQAKKEVIVDYVPQTHESKLAGVPIAKSVGRTDLMVISESEKDLHIEIEKTMKKEQSLRLVVCSKSYFFFPFGGSWLNIAFFFASFSRSSAFLSSICVSLFFLLILLIFRHYKQTSNVSPSKMLPFLIRTFHLSRNQKSVFNSVLIEIVMR